MTRLCILVSVFTCSLVWIAVGSESREVTWDDLLPKEAASFEDPYKKLSLDQRADLALVARLRNLVEAQKISADSPSMAEEKEIVARLTAQGLDVDGLLSQRQSVAEQRQQYAEQVDRSVDGAHVRIPGYMLPLKQNAGKLIEFLFVPWVGACIHTPAPPPNQIIHVSVPGGTEMRSQYAPIWLTGHIKLKPDSYDLFLIDGTQSVKVSYAMISNSFAEYSSSESDVLSKVEIPEEALAGHSRWQQWQIQISLIFTKTMANIKDRRGSGPLFLGLLVAFLYGVVHTLGPGHGKAIVISYFVGEGGSLSKGLGMGVRIAIFHVLSAIVIILVTDFAVRQVTGNAPSDYRMIRMISYASIAVIGFWMLWKAVGASRIKHHHHDDHDHSIDDCTEEARHHQHEADHGCLACAALEEKKGAIGWLSLAIGSVPCTGALLVLLYGLANDMLIPSILMVLAISLGMAVAMSGIGMLAILSHRYMNRKLSGNSAKQRRVTSSLRIIGALCILILGVGLFCLTAFTDVISI